MTKRIEVDGWILDQEDDLYVARKHSWRAVAYINPSGVLFATHPTPLAVVRALRDAHDEATEPTEAPRTEGRRSNDELIAHGESIVGDAFDLTEPDDRMTAIRLLRALYNLGHSDGDAAGYARVREMRQFLTRMVKYVREDRAETPGNTRLARLTRQVADYLNRTAGPGDILRAPSTETPSTADAISRVAADRAQANYWSDRLITALDAASPQATPAPTAMQRLIRAADALRFFAIRRDNGPNMLTDEYDAALLASRSLAAIAGDRLGMSLDEFVRRCEVHVCELQESVAPDNALIATLCEAARLAREYGASRSPAPTASAAPTADEQIPGLEREWTAYERALWEENIELKKHLAPGMFPREPALGTEAYPLSEVAAWFDENAPVSEVFADLPQHEKRAWTDAYRSLIRLRANVLPAPDAAEAGKP